MAKTQESFAVMPTVRVRKRMPSYVISRHIRAEAVKFLASLSSFKTVDVDVSTSHKFSMFRYFCVPLWNFNITARWWSSRRNNWMRRLRPLLSNVRSQIKAGVMHKSIPPRNCILQTNRKYPAGWNCDDRSHPARNKTIPWSRTKASAV